MKTEKVVLSNDWRGIRSLSLRQFVSSLTPRPLWLTRATMCTYRVQTFNLFKTLTISIILSAFENWKFKQSLTKMIAIWMTWQDFPLKRKLYYLSVFKTNILWITVKPIGHCTEILLYMWRVFLWCYVSPYEVTKLGLTHALGLIICNPTMVSYPKCQILSHLKRPVQLCTFKIVTWLSRLAHVTIIIVEMG